MVMAKTHPMKSLVVDEFNKDFDNIDIICGYRKPEEINFSDPYIRKLQIFNRLITKSECRDLGCSLKY